MSSPERLGTCSAVGNGKLRSAKVHGRYAHLSGLEEQIMAKGVKEQFKVSDNAKYRPGTSVTACAGNQQC
ncbi:unnamed protein product, partial [Bubo scandiacus]